jgi:hypothetical protein
MLPQLILRPWATHCKKHFEKSLFVGGGGGRIATFLQCDNGHHFVKCKFVSSDADASYFFPPRLKHFAKMRNAAEEDEQRRTIGRYKNSANLVETSSSQCECLG